MHARFVKKDTLIICHSSKTFSDFSAPITFLGQKNGANNDRTTRESERNSMISISDKF